MEVGYERFAAAYMFVRAHTGRAAGESASTMAGVVLPLLPT
jgi:hypothetical protein